MTADVNQEIKPASVLSFERKLDPSDALFFAGQWDARNASESWPVVTLHEKSVRGTFSNRLPVQKDKDPAKLNATLEHANLQTVDAAVLPADADTLKMVFSLRVHGDVGKPCACNSDAYGAKLMETVRGYVQEQGFDELARRYATNLANGRFLWRNRVGAEQVEVHVQQLKNGQPAASWVFNALGIPLHDMTAPSQQANEIAQLSEVIASGLAGSSHVLLQITAFSRMGAGQEVFPSQELILNRDNKSRSRGQKSKTLYDVDGTAAMHSQKIGNALRTIDTWYAGAAENGPIAIDPYGSVTTQGKSWRWQNQKKQDFYSLFDDWVVKGKAPDVEQQHFVVAMLIRGGVFGKSE